MKVKMLTGMAGTERSLAPGDVHSCDDAEAARLIAAGAAVPVTDRVAEKAVKAGAVETR